MGETLPTIVFIFEPVCTGSLHAGWAPGFTWTLCRGRLIWGRVLVGLRGFCVLDKRLARSCCAVGVAVVGLSGVSFQGCVGYTTIRFGGAPSCCAAGPNRRPALLFVCAPAGSPFRLPAVQVLCAFSQ